MLVSKQRVEAAGWSTMKMQTAPPSPDEETEGGENSGFEGSGFDGSEEGHECEEGEEEGEDLAEVCADGACLFPSSSAVHLPVSRLEASRRARAFAHRPCLALRHG